MKKWILACGIIVIAIMGLQLTAQDVSSAEHINNQVALETTQTMMKIQATPRPLEMYDADGWKKYYVSGGYQYTYIGSGKGIRIERFSDNSPWSKSQKVLIPSEIDGHPVRRLAANSFSQNSYIEEVIIPDSVEVIGSQAFMMCKSLQRVHIGKTVRKIDNDAFYMCRKLEKISGGESLKMLGLRTFQYCEKLRVLPFKERFYKLDFGEMLCGNTGIQNVSFDKNVVLANGLFRGCRRLKTANLSKIQNSECTDDLFRDCIALRQVKINKNWKYIENRIFYNCRNLTSVNIPSKVRRVGSKAFGNCRSLKKIKMPKSVKKIEKDAFKGCKKLTLYVKKGSYAHKYAKKYHVKYKYWK